MVSGPASSGSKNDLTISLSVPIAGDFRPVSATSTGRETRILLIALLAAILLHASAIFSVLVEWPDFGRAIERRDIPVELVFEPPPQIEEPRDIPPPPERESGGDPNLAQGRPADVAPAPTAPPKPSPAKPAEAPSPLPEPAPTDRLADFAPPLKKPEPPSPPAPPKQTEAAAAAPQPAPPAQTAKAPPRQPSRLSVIGQGGGDVYLNQLHDMIEKQRSYPDIANPMRLSGVAIFEIRLSRDGQIANLILLRSTGAGPLDQEAGRIVRRAAPFPPVPPDIRSNLPGNLLGLRLDLPMHP
jgi:TonB family protein